jgi:hypothetical protein
MGLSNDRGESQTALLACEPVRLLAGNNADLQLIHLFRQKFIVENFGLWPRTGGWKCIFGQPCLALRIE